MALVSVCIIVYFLFFCVLLSIFFAVACGVSPVYSEIFLSATPKVDPWFGGFFIAFAAFSNCGFSVFASSVVPLGNNPGLIIWLCILILTGNIAFPAVLRLMLLLMEVLGFEKRFNIPIALLSRNPRAYYNMLFPLRYVGFLTVLWLCLYLVNFALVMGLEWQNTMSNYDPGQKLANAIFSTVTNRTAGLNVLSTGSFRGALLVFDVAMFVISSSPNVIAMKVSRTDNGQNEKKHNAEARQFTRELFINVVIGLTFCWVLVLLFEYQNPWVSTPFPTLFEIASAFGTIGLSMGFGASNASLSGAYSVPSKLVIIILMTIGAHRSMPENIDSAIRVYEIPTGHVVETEIVLEHQKLKKRFLTKADLSFARSRKRTVSE